MEAGALELTNEPAINTAAAGNAKIDLHKVALLIKELAEMRQESRRQTCENATQAAELKRLQNALSSIQNTENANTKDGIGDNKCNTEKNDNINVNSTHKDKKTNKTNLSERHIVEEEKEEELLCKEKELLKWKYRYCHLRHKYKHFKSHHARELIGIQHMVEQLAMSKEEITPTRSIEMNHDKNNITTTEKAINLSIHKSPYNEYEEEEEQLKQYHNDKTCELDGTIAHEENSHVSYKSLLCHEKNANCKNGRKYNNNLVNNTNLVSSASKPFTLADLPEMVYFDENDANVSVSTSDDIDTNNAGCSESNNTNTNLLNVQQNSKTNAIRKTNIALFANTPNSSHLHNHKDTEHTLYKLNSSRENNIKSVNQVENIINLEEKEEWFDNLLLRAIHEQQGDEPCKQSNNSATTLHPYNITLKPNNNKENECSKRNINNSRRDKKSLFSTMNMHNAHNMEQQQQQQQESSTSLNTKRELSSLTESVEYALNKSIADKQEQIRAKVYAEFDRHDKLLEQINRLQHAASMYTWRKPASAAS